MMSDQDYYAVLQVSPEAGQEEVEAAYRRLASEYHPDTAGEPGAGERMAELNEAFEVLGDPAKRAAYDRDTGHRPDRKLYAASAPQSLADYYAVLGVSPDATREEIAAAYEHLARVYQPDVNSDPEDPAKMQELNEAFDTLDDPQRRVEYDRTLALMRPEVAPPPAAGAEAAPADTVTPAAAETAPAAAGPSAPKPWLALALIALGAAAIIGAIAIVIVDANDSGNGGEVTTASGLKYIDTLAGSGATAESRQVVTVAYTGKLDDGSVFDSTDKHGQPFAFTLGAGEVIPGWDEGIASMKVGGKRTLIIPPELAYGAEGRAPVIPANATLTFDVELLDIQEPAPATPPAVSGTETTTDSGLKYIDIEKGSGATPQAGQTVTVHYTGWLEADGSKFDSSLDHGQPFSFTLGAGNVIRGWDEGLATMKVGGKRRLIIPPILGYSSQGSAPVIPANATLIFDVELLDAQ